MKALVKKGSHSEMLAWQYKMLLSELQHLEMHASGDCPCILNDLNPPERCVGKHSLNVFSLAQETAKMDPINEKMLLALSEEADEKHQGFKDFICHTKDLPELANWARAQRKIIEPIYYTCDVKAKSAHLHAPLQEIEHVTIIDNKHVLINHPSFPVCQASLHAPAVSPAVKVVGSCGADKQCSFKVTATKKAEAHVATCKSLPKAVEDVIQRALAGTSKAAPAVTDKTFAMGITTSTRYEFRHKIVEGADLIVSNDPFTFARNPAYERTIQPRERGRAATQLQVENIAANLTPDLLLLDFLSIDKGSPIVGPDNLVECGNGRVMGIIRAAKAHPAKFDAYRQHLKLVAPSYGLSPDVIGAMKVPILVRERLTKVDRKAFAEECNARTTIQSSAVETAKTDAEKITTEMLNGLDVLEGEAIEAAIKASRNKPFVVAFLNKLPANEQAGLVDSKGVLSQEGVRRIVMAIFVATFRGDTGLLLAEKFFEATDPDVKTVFAGLLRSLAVLARAESLVKSGSRESDYTIGEDLAKVIAVYSRIKNMPDYTVAKYMAQQSLEVRELNPFQERVLQVLDQNARSGKRIGQILSNYGQAVIDSPPPSQTGFFPGAKTSKPDLFEGAVKKALTVPEFASMSADFEARWTKAQQQEAMKHQIPFTGATCPPICPLPETGKKKYELYQFQKEGVAWLKGRSYALLADEMGLGKTPQGIHWGADFRPVLVVVPSALIFNWQREIKEMWRTSDTVTMLDGETVLPSTLTDWTVISYGMVPKYLPSLKKAGFKAIIIDEAHLVKNLDTQRTKNILELVSPTELVPGDKPIPNRLAITGTPILNRPVELFALMVFLGVKRRGEFKQFLDTYTKHEWYQGKLRFTGTRNLAGLYNELKPFMVRRYKKDVLSQLPPKVNTPMFVPISNASEYRQAEKNFLTWLREKHGDEAARRASKAEIIAKMNHLRQLAAEGKVAPVADWLKPCGDGQGKVIVFSSFIGPLEELKRRKHPMAAIYHGAVSSQDRQNIVDDFQRTSNICYFLGTVGAAGVGITLTTANRVAFLDLPWTPGGKIQAEDRAHRIGQTKTVEIVNVLARGTIDERMLKILADKEFIIAQAIDGKTKEQAQSTSIAESLIDSFIKQPAILNAVAQYQPDNDEVEIMQGLRADDSQTASLFDLTGTLIKKLDKCNLDPGEAGKALSWKPLRDFIAWAVSKGKVSLCSVGMVPGVYQLTVSGLKDVSEVAGRAKIPGAKRVWTLDNNLVYEIVLPDEQPKEMTWGTQEVCKVPARKEQVAQAAMFNGKQADLHDPLLAEIATQICSTGACFAAPRFPVCRGSKVEKFERCVQEVKAKDGKVNPFAVCTTSLKCHVEAGTKC